MHTGNQDGSGNAIFRYKLKQLNISKSKLKSSSRISALLAGFAIVAIVELQLEPRCRNYHDLKNTTAVYNSTENTTNIKVNVFNSTENTTHIIKQTCSKVPESLLITFGICETLVVAVHLIALMISTCILPHVEAMSNMIKLEPHLIDESPHITLHTYVEIAWFFSTVLGLLLFLILIGLITWVKFIDISIWAGIGSTFILIPTIIIFSMFAIHFYCKLIGFKVKHADTELRSLEHQLTALHNELEFSSNASKCRSSVYSASIYNV